MASFLSESDSKQEQLVVLFISLFVCLLLFFKGRQGLAQPDVLTQLIEQWDAELLDAHRTCFERCFHLANIVLCIISWFFFFLILHKVYPNAASFSCLANSPPSPPCCLNFLLLWLKESGCTHSRHKDFVFFQHKIIRFKIHTEGNGLISLIHSPHLRLSYRYPPCFLCCRAALMKDWVSGVGTDKNWAEHDGEITITVPKHFYFVLP